MLKRLLVMLIFILTAVSAQANVVEVHLDESMTEKISSFQLFFEDSNDFGFPLETDWETYDMDFTYGFGLNQQKRNFWELTSALLIDDNATPSNEDDDKWFAKGIGGVASALNENLALNTGLILTMESINTQFRINLDDPKNGFFNFSGINGELIDFTLTETWQGDKQIVSVGAVPIPSSILLLGAGICALLGISRKKQLS